MRFFKGMNVKQKTYSQKAETVKRSWRIVDAKDQVLGRLATHVADVLRGKDKVTFTPHVDVGDFVVVVNAGEVKLTGDKLNSKMYYNYSGYRGGMKTKSASELISKNPEELIKAAVWGMLPKGTLGRQIFKKLKVYPGSDHPHEAQQPSKMALGVSNG